MKNITKVHNENGVDGVHMHLENKKISRHFFIFLFIMYSIVYMTKNCFSSALAAIVAEGAMTKSQAGIITAAFYVVYTPLQIVGGIFADKYNPERMIKIGLIGSAISNMIIFLNQNFWVMLISWVFNAIIQFPLWPSVFKIMSSQLVRSDRRMMIFYMSFATSFGLFLAYLTAAFITNWEYNFLLSAGLLFILAIVLHFYYNKVEPSMKKDKEVPLTVQKSASRGKFTATFKLFAASGFLLLSLLTIFRCSIEQGIKTLAPTMLMESYSNVSPTFGNLMGTIIIIMGILGTVLIRIVYPRWLRNEYAGYLALLSLSLPFVIIMKYIGNIHLAIAVGAMCVTTLFLTATHLLASHCSLYFTKYGKNGTAAGFINAMGSFGVVIYSYGFSKIAEIYNWNVVMDLLIVFTVVCIVLNIVACILWSRFRKNEKEFEENI